jgi:hypothetical protein
MAQYLEEIRDYPAGREERGDILGAGTGSVVNHQGINALGPKPSGG